MTRARNPVDVENSLVVGSSLRGRMMLYSCMAVSSVFMASRCIIQLSNQVPEIKVISHLFLYKPTNVDEARENHL